MKKYGIYLLAAGILILMIAVLVWNFQVINQSASFAEKVEGQVFPIASENIDVGSPLERESHLSFRVDEAKLQYGQVHLYGPLLITPPTDGCHLPPTHAVKMLTLDSVWVNWDCGGALVSESYDGFTLILDEELQENEPVYVLIPEGVEEK